MSGFKEKTEFTNKITTKNAWELPIIDKFTSASFIEHETGEAFQKASLALQSCAQIYATRIDDVSSAMSKLIVNFDMKKDTKEKTRKSTKTLAADPAMITLKDFSPVEIIDREYLDFEKTRKGFMNSRFHNDCVFRLFENKNCNIIFDENTYELQSEFSGKNICPKILSGSDSPEESILENINFDINEFNNHYDANETIIDENLEPDRIMDFDAWAGPNYWKTPTKSKTRVNKRKTTQTERVSFDRIVDTDSILKQSVCTMSHDFIQQRRSKSKLLPFDHQITKDTILSYFYLPGTITEDNNTSNSLDFSFDVHDDRKDTSFEKNQTEKDVLDHEVKKPAKTNQSNTKFVDLYKVPKKINVQVLKEKLFSSIESKSEVTVAEVCSHVLKDQEFQNDENKPTIYDCILSLLHLANEKNLSLENDNDNNIQIRHPAKKS